MFSPNAFSFRQPTSTPSFSAFSQDDEFNEKGTCGLPPLPALASQKRNECFASPSCGKCMNDGLADYSSASPISVPRPTHELLHRKKASSVNPMQPTSPFYQSFSGGKIFFEISTSISFFRQNVSLMLETKYLFRSRSSSLGPRLLPSLLAWARQR